MDKIQQPAERPPASAIVTTPRLVAGLPEWERQHRALLSCCGHVYLVVTGEYLRFYELRQGYMGSGTLLYECPLEAVRSIALADNPSARSILTVAFVDGRRLNCEVSRSQLARARQVVLAFHGPGR